MLGPSGLDILLATDDEIVTTGTATGGSATTLVHSGAGFNTNGALAGLIVEITSGTGAGQTRRILSNTGDTLTVDEAWEVAPVSGSQYRIVDLIGDVTESGGNFVHGALDDIMSYNNLDKVSDIEDAEIWWKMKVGGNLVNAGADIGFDIGIPGLGLSTEGEIVLDINWQLELGFGLSGKDGFFLFVDDPNELLVDLEVTLPGASITGSLAFLEFTAENADVDDTDEIAGGDTYFAASFAIDIRNDGDPTDARLGLSEIGRLGFDVLVLSLIHI